MFKKNSLLRGVFDGILFQNLMIIPVYSFSALLIHINRTIPCSNTYLKENRVEKILKK